MTAILPRRRGRLSRRRRVQGESKEEGERLRWARLLHTIGRPLEPPETEQVSQLAKKYGDTRLGRALERVVEKAGKERGGQDNRERW